MNSIWLEPLSTLFIVCICAQVANIIARLWGCEDLSEPWSRVGAKRTKLPCAKNGLLKSNMLTYKQVRKLKKYKSGCFNVFRIKEVFPPNLVQEESLYISIEKLKSFAQLS